MRSQVGSASSRAGSGVRCRSKPATRPAVRPFGALVERLRGDEGAAVVDFVFISILLLILLISVLQVAIYFYVRNVAASSAADAARYAAAEGVDPQDGAGRATQLLRQALDDADASAITCDSGPGVDAASGLTVTTVRCRGRVRLLFSPLKLPLTIDVRSSVLRESVPTR